MPLYKVGRSGCSCHEEELTSGKKIVCPFKGRWIPEAWWKVQAALDAMNAAAKRMDDKFFLGGDTQIDHRAAGRWNATVVALAKFGFLDCPVLDVALGTARSPASEHYPVTQSLFADDSGLSMLVAGRQDGGALHSKVQAVRDAVADIPLMDSLVEGPHAQATRLGAASRASA